MYHYSKAVLEILRWTAIGHTTPITDSDGDQYGEECVFDTCTYDTSENRTAHSPTCLQTLARKELTRLGMPLRKTTISFTFIDTPTQAFLRQQALFNRSVSIKEIPQQREYWTLEKLKFNPTEFIATETARRMADRYQGNYVTTIDPHSLVISKPEFFEA